MAVDTYIKRASVMALAGGLAPLPLPDGAFGDAVDIARLLELYAGLVLAAPNNGALIVAAYLSIEMAYDATMTIE